METIEGLVLLLVVLIVFGGSQVPKLVRALRSSKQLLLIDDKDNLESQLKKISEYKTQGKKNKPKSTKTKSAQKNRKKK